MDNRPCVTCPTSSYDEFLFASICEETNGMRLSVLSALARINVDPWEEAARLAAMPKDNAERTLVSTIDLVASRTWNSTERETIAARLVQLLPQRAQGTTFPATDIAETQVRQTFFWLAWVGFTIAMLLLSPHPDGTAAKVDNSTSTASAISPSTSGSESSTLPGSSSPAH